MNSADGDGFLARWSRRKVQVRQGEAAPEPAPVVAPTVPAVTSEPGLPKAAVAAPAVPPPQPATDARPPAPTLDDVAQLSRTSDFRRFVAADVDPGVKNAALKKLFADPHFNVMDGLDTYIDDYGKPDPIPAAMLRQMVQSKALGLFADEDQDTTGQTVQPTPVAAGATPDGAAPVDAAQSLH